MANYVHLAHPPTEAEAIEYALRQLLGLNRRADDGPPNDELLAAAVVALDKVDAALHNRHRLTTSTPRRSRSLPAVAGASASWRITEGAFAGCVGTLEQAAKVRSWEAAVVVTSPPLLAGMVVSVRAESLEAVAPNVELPATA